MAPENISLNYHLFKYSRASDDLRHLIVDISRAGKYISYEIQTTLTGLAGSSNQFGEQQVKLDVFSDHLIQQFLCENDLVASFISEEQPEQIKLSENGKYSVVFDPLDGSSLVDVNFSVGSIFGIYEGSEIIGHTPREQVAALYLLYGPRTILVYSTGSGVHQFLLNDVGEFILIKEHLTIEQEAKNYSPGNLRAISDNTRYNELLKDWLERSLTLRYSGCMVADVHHIFTKGQGIFTNIGGSKYPGGKLRHVFECGPFSYLANQAGGSASDGQISLLDKKIITIDQRTPIIIGSKKEVNHAVEVLTP